MTRILGIDPGSQRTGIGIIDVGADGRLQHVYHAAINVLGNEDFHQRLKQIFDEVSQIIDMHAPVEAAIERVFMARNPDSALKLGQARGAAICAVVNKGLGLSEYAAKGSSRPSSAVALPTRPRFSTWSACCSISRVDCRPMPPMPWPSR